MSNRLLKQALFLSGGLNIVLVALFFYLVCRDNQSRLFFSYKPKQMEAVTPLVLLEDKSYEQLIRLLEDQKFRQQALYTLVANFDFDLERACMQRSVRRMSESDYSKVIHFVKEEVYPFTAKGLYKRLPETAELFSFTQEFVQLEILFDRAGVLVNKQTLLTLVAEGRFETLASYCLEQKKGANYSELRRQQLLMDYIQDGSRTAAYLLLLTDPEYAKVSLTDEETMDLLQLLNVKTVEASLFVKATLESKRGEVCKKKALERLSEYDGKEAASRHTHKSSVGKLEPLAQKRCSDTPPINTYVIQDGDSLWLIAKRHHVSIDELMKVNHLQSSTIRPGKSLKIPQSTGS